MVIIVLRERERGGGEREGERESGRAEEGKRLRERERESESFRKVLSVDCKDHMLKAGRLTRDNQDIYFLTHMFLLSVWSLPLLVQLYDASCHRVQSECNRAPVYRR